MTQSISRFDGKTALITGGTSGMGLATARRLLAEGARVVITGRDQSRLDAAVEDLDGGDRILALRGDVASLADLDALVVAIRERYGRLDVVFANAGAALYSATKAAVHNLAHTLAAELGPRGIRVNSSLPARPPTSTGRT